MKQFLFLFFSLVIAKTVAAQGAIKDSSVAIVSYWDKGDVFRYNLKCKKDKFRNGRPSSTSSSTAELTISVIDASDTSYTLSGIYDKVVVKLPKNEQEMTMGLIKFAEGLNFKYRTSEVGDFQELLNWETVRNWAYQMIEGLDTKGDTGYEEAVLDATRKVFSTKESIEMLMAKEIQLLHTVYGGEYELNQRYEIEGELPNFLGGPPFPATITLKVDRVDYSNQTCEISMTNEVDKEKLTETMEKWMTDIGKPKDIKLPTISLSELYTFKIDVEKGVVLNASLRVTAEADTYKSIEIRELTIIP